MNPTHATISISVQSVEKSYCSKQQRYAKPTTAKSGLHEIEKILRQARLCFHDGERIGAIYRAIDLAEREQIYLPEGSISNRVLQAVIKKIDQISEQNLTSDQLVSFYHLEKFLKKNIGFSRQQRIDYFKEKLQNKREIAESLSFCCSEEQYKRDIDFFDVDCEETKELLSSQKQKFTLFTTKSEKLKEFRQNYPDYYPHYFDKLLKLRCFVLYDHMIKIEEVSRVGVDCAEKIKTIENDTNCIAFVDIILETINVIRQSVLKALPVDISQKKIFFLLGDTKAGKSTSLCFLRGDSMHREESAYTSQSHEKNIIGDNIWNSCTFLPSVEIVGDLVFVDFPGFDDSHGSFISLGIKLALHKILKELAFRSEVRALLLSPFLVGSVGSTHNVLREKADNLFENTNKCSLIGLTKYTENPQFKNLETACETLKTTRDLLESKRNLLENIRTERQEQAYKRVTSFEEQIQEAIEEIRDITEDIQDLEEDIQELEKKKKVDRIRKKQAKLERCQGKLENQQNRLETLQDLLNQAQAAVEIGEPIDREIELEEEILGLVETTSRLVEEIPERERGILQLEKEILQRTGRLAIEDTEHYDGTKHLSFAKLDKLDRNTFYEKLITSPLEPIKAHTHIILSSSEKALLDAQFVNVSPKDTSIKGKLEQELAEGKLRGELPKELNEEEILEKGLISTLLGDRVATFFQEFHPGLQREYDKAILKEVLKIYVTKIVRDIKVMSQKADQSSQKTLKESIKDLEKSAINEWVGSECTENNICIEEISSEELENLRNCFQQEIELMCKEKATDFEDSLLVGFFRRIGLTSRADRTKTAHIKDSSTKDVIKKYDEEITQHYTFLNTLGNIRIIVEKKHELEKLYPSHSNSESVIDFPNSAREKIKKVRELYGEDNWDKRIKTLRKRVKKEQGEVKSRLEKLSGKVLTSTGILGKDVRRAVAILLMYTPTEKLVSTLTGRLLEQEWKKSLGLQKNIFHAIVDSTLYNAAFLDLQVYWNNLMKISLKLKLDMHFPLQRFILAQTMFPEIGEKD